MKKGFTLIEILSVIIILGIIFLFITPKISNLIKDSRNLSKEIEEITIINSVKEYANSYEKEFFSSFLNVGDKGYILVSDIISKGNISKKEIEEYGVADTDYVEVELIENDKFTYKFVSNMEEIRVKFDLDGGLLEEDSMRVKYNEPYGILPRPTKLGYNFIGWYTEKTGGEQIVSSTIVKEKKAHTLYARWSDKVSLTVDLNNGSSSQTFNQKYKIGEAITLINPTRTGYTFTGWTVTEGNSIISGNTLTMGSDDTTIIANWQINMYLLDINGLLDGIETENINNYGTFDLYIDGELIGNDIIDYHNLLPYGTRYEIKDIKASSNKIYNGVSLGNLSGTLQGASSVRLSFTTNSYNLSVNLNGGSTNQTFKQTYKVGEVITLISPTRTGYTFIGWTVTIGNGVISGNTLTMGNSNTTIVANWKASTTIPIFTYTGSCQIVDDSGNIISNTSTCGKSDSGLQSTWTGNWKIYFLTSGTLNFSFLGSASNGIDTYLVGGGGGGGGSDGGYGKSNSGGGGGAGGQRALANNLTISVNTNYNIVVGKGGTGAANYATAGGSGENSSAFGKIAAGGGGGALKTPGTGGTSGGIGGRGNGTSGFAGENGGYEFNQSTGELYGGGGGGGAGYLFANNGGCSNGGAGGKGGGGAGGSQSNGKTGKNGTENTGGGGGGGGCGYAAGGSGGSGIVIIRNNRNLIDSEYVPVFTYTGNYIIVNDNDELLTEKETNWKIKFLTSGILRFSSLGNANDGIDVFLVGGGGGGGGSDGGYGKSNYGGGGGAGGYRTVSKNLPLAINVDYEIIVGNGGAGATSYATIGGTGESSSAFGKVAAGGSGGRLNTSGIGGANGGTGGLGNGTSGLPGEKGGYEFNLSTGKLYGGGGGGGAGYLFTNNGGCSEFGAGGDGGGGTGGGVSNGNIGRVGTENTGGGGGGGGCGYASGGNGGSGIVIIRNKR